MRASRTRQSRVVELEEGGEIMAVSRRVRTGFTLVELLVVITIIGMLMALIFPAFGAFLARTRVASCQNNLKQVAGAVRMYESKKLVFPGWLHRMQTRR